MMKSACMPICLVLFSAHSVASELKNPPQISGQRLINLTATTTSPHPYTIEGFNGKVDGLLLYKVNQMPPSLRPALWRIQPGQSLRVHLHNDLPCSPNLGEHSRADQTNLHTHGLIVAPNDKASDGTYGDNAMMMLDTSRCRGLEAGNLPKTAQYKITLPMDHPYGLSWYHPHVHGVAGKQVGSGMSGLISIGDVWSYAYVKYANANAFNIKDDIGMDERVNGKMNRAREEKKLRQNTKQLYLMLKDLQITKPKTRRSNTFDYLTPMDTTLCGDAAIATQGVCSGSTDDADRKWLFTVNGQVYPTITVNKGKRHVWRIANVGATVSYRLQLRVTTPAYAGKMLPFQVLVSDGVALTTSKSAAKTQASITLMPSARVEIALDPMQVCRELNGSTQNPKMPCSMGDVQAVLETANLQTGADVWPNAELAKVLIRATGSSSSSNDPGLMGVSLANQTVTASQFVRPNRPVPAPCENPTSIAADEYRLIGLKNETVAGVESFKMATKGPFKLDATGLPSKTTFEDDPASYQAFDATKVNLCVGADIDNKYSETWVVKNDSDEIHNFHVHQSKFEVLQEDKIPGDIIVTRPSGKGVFHDNFPVNPHGWILLRIKFDHKEQVGKFMYHCHILEHEDKGMMSIIQVVDTGANAALTSPAQNTAAGAHPHH